MRSMARVTNMLSRWVKMFFLMGTMEVRKSLRRIEVRENIRNMLSSNLHFLLLNLSRRKINPPSTRERTTRQPDTTSPASISAEKAG